MDMGYGAHVAAMRTARKRVSAKRKGGGGAKPDANAPVGQGGRFAALKQKFAGRKGIRSPGGLAASIGRKKYGKSRFQHMAAAGH